MLVYYNERKEKFKQLSHEEKKNELKKIVKEWNGYKTEKTFQYFEYCMRRHGIETQKLIEKTEVIYYIGEYGIEATIDPVTAIENQQTGKLTLFFTDRSGKISKWS
jgi:hypothetical protein